MQLNKKNKKKTFFTYVFLGISLALALRFLSVFTFVASPLNNLYDLIIYHDARISTNESYDDIYFIDVEHSDLKEAGFPDHMPRKKLAEFTRIADRNSAKVVVIDVLLEYPSSNAEEDQFLRSELARLSKEKSTMKIVFPVKMKADGTGPSSTIVDDFINKNPNFYRACIGTIGSKTDRKVRKMNFFETFHGKNNSLELIWSIPFLATVLYEGKELMLEDFRNELLSSQGESPWYSQGFKFPISKGQNISFNKSMESDLIRYRLIPQGVIDSTHPGTLYDKKIVPSILPFVRDTLENKMVIVGSSASYLRDIHSTSIGQLPGMYILGNATNTLVQGMQIKTDLPLRVIIEAIMILIFSAFLLYIPPVYLEILSVVLTFAFVLPFMAHFIEYAPIPVLFVDLGLFCILIDCLNERHKIKILFTKSLAWVRGTFS